MAKTKKVGTTGRYGVRYGTRTKKVVASMEKEQRKRQVCPYCERNALKRVSAGIWKCKKCGNKFAGAAYFPKSKSVLAGEKNV
jgi:large subunit ribosomal protein L37Ae